MYSDPKHCEEGLTWVGRAPEGQEGRGGWVERCGGPAGCGGRGCRAWRGWRGPPASWRGWDPLPYTWSPEPVFVDSLRSPEIYSQPGGPVRQPYMLYRPARQHGLAASIPGLHKRLQIRALHTEGRRDMQETPKRKITVTSSLYEMFKGNTGGGGWSNAFPRTSHLTAKTPPLLYSRLLDRYIKTTWTVFPPHQILLHGESENLNP